MNEQKHLSLERLLEYFTAGLDEYELEMIEEHLGECESCSARARRVYPLTEGWTPEAHAAAVAAEARANDPLVRALTRAQAFYSDLETRLKAWLARPDSLWQLPGTPVPEFGTGAVAVRGTKATVLSVNLPTGTTRARVVVAQKPQTVEVRTAAEAVIILFREDEDPIVVLTANRIARFDDVPPGEYQIAITPIG